MGVKPPSLTEFLLRGAIAQGKCGDFCLLLPALCLDTAHSQKTKIPTFFLALTPLITKFRERWGLTEHLL
jgi:hypothetical protein